jgi:hypothetical protein
MSTTIGNITTVIFPLPVTGSSFKPAASRMGGWKSYGIPCSSLVLPSY